VRRAVVLALVISSSVACGAVGARWEKSGASEAERRRDEAECASRASRETTVPTAERAGSRAGTPYESQQVRIRDYDSGVFDECMRTRGYERVPGRAPG
jgi:hypothetical protein